MADIISRLKLESGEFDSKIKRASQELTAYSQHCRKMGLEMGYANKDAKEFAKSLGSMQTTATTTRGKVSELSDAFVNLKAMYNQMTDAEKQGHFGKNLAASLDQLKQRTQQAKQELADITKELNGASNIGGGGGLFSGDKLSGMLQVFGGNLMTKAAGFAASFATEIAGCVTQGIELAKQGEGIRIAFERLGRGDILQGLREATHGTVTDLELMKAAVKFNDFKLPVEELGTMLAFAQQKAKDTGQSVDYMVDSIVTGLGRKSLMILDNLGLSAAEIKEKMKQTGDMTKSVGAIIREQMAKSGDYIETAADRATKADVELKNAMEELGRTFQPLADAGTSMWTALETGALKFLSKVGSVIAQLTEAGRVAAQYGEMGGSDRVGSQLTAYRGAKDKDSYRKAVLASYDAQIRQREQVLAGIDAWRGGDRSDANRAAFDKMEQYGVGRGDNAALRAQINALRQQRDKFDRGAVESAINSPTTTTTTTTKATKTGKTSDQTIREQFAAQQRDSLAYSGSYKSTAADQPSDAWRAFTESQTESQKSIVDALQELNKKEGISPKGKREGKKEEKTTANITKEVGNIAGGIGSVVGGLEQLGIDIPEGIKGAVGVLQTIVTIVSGIATTVLAIEALTAADSFIPFFARGGIIPHAAGGYFVGGSHYSGDVTPIMANAGELVLSRSQQFNLASQLEGNGMQGLNLTATIRGEQIRLALNNNGRRTGRGEYVQSRNVR